MRDLNGYAGLIGGQLKLDDRAAFSGCWLWLNRVDFTQAALGAGCGGIAASCWFDFAFGRLVGIVRL